MEVVGFERKEILDGRGRYLRFRSSSSFGAFKRGIALHMTPPDTTSRVRRNVRWMSGMVVSSLSTFGAITSTSCRREAEEINPNDAPVDICNSILCTEPDEVREWERFLQYWRILEAEVLEQWSASTQEIVRDSIHSIPLGSWVDDP